MSKQIGSQLPAKTLLSLTLCGAALATPSCAQNKAAAPQIRGQLSASSAKTTAAASSGNFIKNADFETVSAGKLAAWQVSGIVKPEAISGSWRRMTAKFRSGNETKVGFFFWVPRGASGSVWIDNLSVGPNIEIKNPSFETIDADGKSTDWTELEGKNTVFYDSKFASEGKTSLRITHQHEAVPSTMVYQDFAVEPNKEYTISLDMYVGDDFQGEAKGWLFNAAHVSSIDFDIENLLASKIVEDRDRSDRFDVVMNAVKGVPAVLSQEIAVQTNANLQASLDFNNSAFKGDLKYIVQDVASGSVLHESSTTASQEKWQTVKFSLQSVSPKVRVRIVANGEGALRIDNSAVTSPQVSPPLQQAQWLTAADNFKIPANLNVSVQGKEGIVIDGALSLLNKDLKQYGVVAKKQNSPTTPIQILIGDKYAVKGKSDEAYTLAVNSKSVVIKSATAGGAFYGMMTLLQLIDARAGKPVFLPCNITDYPDMPLRGFFYADAEQAARWKLNTLMVSTGYPVTPAEKKDLRGVIEHCQSLNLDVIPMFMTLQGSYYVQGINPNLAAGIWVQNEKVQLSGTAPSNLANRYVIRTGLSDVKLKSADGTKEYKLGVDYDVINGEMKYNYDNPNAKPFGVIRLPNSSIPDGATVLASYDYVSHVRHRSDVHIPYVFLEPETRKLTGDYLKSLASEYNFKYIGSVADLHEFDNPDLHLSTDSRVIKSGKRPIDLLIEDANFQAAAIKSGNPQTRVFQWAGSQRDYVTEAGPKIPKDSLINIWGYDAPFPAAEGRKALDYWTKLGFQTSVMSWDNMRNIRGWAQVVVEARQKGYNCVGLIGAGWEGRPTGFKETTVVAWKVPKPGDKNYVPLSKW